MQIGAAARAGIWQIAEPESFFLERIGMAASPLHPHKKLQGLAARFLLTELIGGLPVADIRTSPSGKPYIEGSPLVISLSHSGDLAAAIAGTVQRAGIDIERVTPKVSRVANKFLNPYESDFLSVEDMLLHQTICWCAKEALFKWFGAGGLNFKEHLRLHPFSIKPKGEIRCSFRKPGNFQELSVAYEQEGQWCVAWCVEAADPSR
jgi:4'-phosphopantetheinyl transferase